MPGTLVIQTAYRGDVVLTTPLLTALAQTSGPVDVVLTPTTAPILQGHRAVRQITVYDKRGRDRGVQRFVQLANSLRQVGYGRAIIPHRSMRSATLAMLAGIPERIGFGGTLASLTYTRRVSRDVKAHEADRLAALAEHGIPLPVDLDLSDQEREEARSWLKGEGIEGTFVVIAPGATWGTKRWPYFETLAERVPGAIVVVGGTDDREAAAEITLRDPARIRSAAGCVGIRTTAAILAEAAVLVTNDSAPLHLATAVGTPVVAVFGPTIPEFGFGPRGLSDQIVAVPGIPCRPCSPHGPAECPLGHHRCMRTIDVDRVLSAVRTIHT